jgi:hypothetical protein
MGLFFELPNEAILKDKYPKDVFYKDITIKLIKEEIDKITYYTLNGTEEKIRKYFPFVLSIRGNKTINNLYLSEEHCSLEDLIKGEIVNRYEIDEKIYSNFKHFKGFLIKPKIRLNDKVYHIGFIDKTEVILIQLPLDNTSKKLNNINILLNLYLRLLNEEKRDETYKKDNSLNDVGKK